VAMLEPSADTPATEQVVVPPVVAEPVKVDVPAVDPMANAADTLFGDPDKPGDNKAKPAADQQVEKPVVERDPNLPPEGETPEQKAEREAAETPEQKELREAAEAKEAEAKKAADERYGAPEAGYADFTLPEGVEPDTAGIKEVGDIAKALNLSQASAQKLVDLAIAKQARDAEHQQGQLQTIKDGWIEASKTDKEFGGDKLKESLAVAQKALKEFGTPELNELIVGANLGDHPEVIRLLTRVGKRLSEAPIVNGGQPAAKDAESVLYPSLKRKG
jgi:hypothetical protein